MRAAATQPKRVAAHWIFMLTNIWRSKSGLFLIVSTCCEHEELDSASTYQAAANKDRTIVLPAMADAALCRGVSILYGARSKNATHNMRYASMMYIMSCMKIDNRPKPMKTPAMVGTIQWTLL
jgi:hypothetical protein